MGLYIIISTKGKGEKRRDSGVNATSKEKQNAKKIPREQERGWAALKIKPSRGMTQKTGHRGAGGRDKRKCIGHIHCVERRSTKR